MNNENHDGEPRKPQHAGQQNSNPAERAKQHFSGADADQSDPIEVWAKRVGRGLSLIVFLILLFYVLNLLDII